MTVSDVEISPFNFNYNDSFCVHASIAPPALAFGYQTICLHNLSKSIYKEASFEGNIDEPRLELLSE